MQWRGGGQDGKRNAGTDGYEDMDAVAMGNRSKGKPTKKPFAAGGGPTGTDDKWSHTWVTYNEAVKAKEHNPVAAGIGFKIPKGYYFIDIDHKAITDPLVQTILARHDSYAEYSVSGTGIHQYGKCDFTQIPTYIDKNGNLKLDRQFYTKIPITIWNCISAALQTALPLLPAISLMISLCANVPRQSLRRLIKYASQRKSQVQRQA